MDSRKRSHTEEADPIVTKKRAVSNGYESPTRVNGPATDVDEPQEDDELELFRKEAIFRRMKHYSRENERSQHRIEELERRKNACEAGLSAIQACWAQLLDTIRLLVNPQELLPTSIDTASLFDMSVHVDSQSSPDLEKALQEQMDATRDLVASFVQIGSQTRTAVSADGMYINCQKAQTECTALRSEVQVIRTRLKDAESEKEKYHSRLVAAENRLERMSSRTVPTSMLRSSVPLEKPTLEDSAMNGIETLVKTEDVQMKDEAEVPSVSAHEERKPEAEDTKPNGADTLSAEEMDDWRVVAGMREYEIRKLERQIISLRETQVMNAVDQQTPADDSLMKNPLYQALTAGYNRANWRADELAEDLTKAKIETDELRRKLQEERESGNSQIAKVRQDYESVLIKRDADLARLREQRDQQGAEISERKHKDSVKMQSLAEWKSLALTRSDRIAALEIELKRVRSRMAAESGDEDLVGFLFKDASVRGETEDASIWGKTYVDELKERLGKTETELKALQESLSSLNEENPDVAQCIQSEAQAREQATQLSRELEKYRSLYGDSSSDPSIQSRLKEDELQKLKLQLTQQIQAESALYTELEKLSAAWEGLDKQLKSKVFDLSAMEEKLAKALVDKAKLENKFYAAMRDKDAVEMERKVLVREQEKQSKTVQSLQEMQNILEAQVIGLQAAQGKYTGIMSEYGNATTKMNDQIKELMLRIEAEKARATQVKVEFRQALNQYSTQQTELRHREEAIKKKEKEVERLHAQAQTKLRSTSESGVSMGKGREEELQGEVDKLMSVLKCSTCRQNMRNVVITKCMHSFCKDCVEARISTRQRKCPACNLPFGQGDVQPLYFQ